MVKSNNNKHYRKCKNCLKMFKLKPSNPQQKYCSDKCWKEYNTKRRG